MNKFLLMMLLCYPAFAMNTVNQSVINAAALNNATYSLAIDARFLDAVSFIGLFATTTATSSASGSLYIQGSNDPSVSGNLPSSFVPASGSWINIPLATSTISSGSLGPISPPMPLSISYRWLRTVWSRVSGSGTITVQMMGQGH